MNPTDATTTQPPSAPTSAGLSTRQAAAVRSRVGRNVIPEPRRPTVALRVFAQLRDPMIMLLLVAAVLTIALDDVSDMVVIAIVVVLNTTVGVVQELRAEHSLAALRRLAAPTAQVVRDGVREVMAAEDVVPGDLLALNAGDIVPADATLTQAHSLQVDESALTGESVPVDKGTSGDEVYAGTVVTRGRALAVVTRTGPRSSLGRIADLLGDQRPRPTPLQRRLAGLGRLLAGAAVGLSLVVAVSGLVRGRPVAEVALTAISLAVAAVPESLPAVVTLALALGAHRMARRAAVVRALPAVETLGSVTVLAADKTGTLTEGRMVVERLWTVQDGEVGVSGSGYDPRGSIDSTAGPPAALDELLRDVVLCNDADLRPPDDADTPWQPIGDPTEAALLAAAGKRGLAVDDTRRAFPRVREIPFDSVRKTMTTVHRVGRTGEWLLVCKGAPEVLLADARLVRTGPQVAMARNAATELAAAGYRVLAVAHQVVGGPAQPSPGDRPLQLAGLVAITDPPRGNAAELVETFRRAGVRLLMITGDHPDTARSLAGRIGMGEDAPGSLDVVTGTELASGLPDERTAGVRVYARIHPEQKLEIVRQWQARGQVVAMTGDGVNDAPALRRADIGVAMGAEGTEVARQAADLVLTDDNLATVAVAIEEGRRIYANIRTFLRYALAGGAAEVAVMLLGPLTGLAVPLLPAQILWINMLTHGLPGVALGAEPADPAAMRSRPRPPEQFILGGLWRPIAWTGALITAVTMGVGVWAHHVGGPWQSLVFLTLGLAQLGVAVALRRPGRAVRFLDAAVAVAVALQLAGVALAPLRSLLGTEPVTVAECAVVAVAAVVPGLATVVIRWAGSAARRQGDPAH